MSQERSSATSDTLTPFGEAMDVLRELVGLIKAHMEGEYEFDSFTTQPAEALLRRFAPVTEAEVTPISLPSAAREPSEPLGYAVVMENGEGPFVGCYRMKVVAEQCRDRQPPSHHDVVIPIYATPQGRDAGNDRQSLSSGAGTPSTPSGESPADVAPLVSSSTAPSTNTALADKVAGFAALKANWDSYGAEPFSEATIELAYGVALRLEPDWKAVPCADGPSVFFYRGDEEEVIEVRANPKAVQSATAESEKQAVWDMLLLDGNCSRPTLKGVAKLRQILDDLIATRDRIALAQSLLDRAKERGELSEEERKSVLSSTRETALADALQLVLDDWANANHIGDDAREQAERALNGVAQSATGRSEPCACPDKAQCEEAGECLKEMGVFK